MALLVCVCNRNNDKLMAALRAALPQETILEWPLQDEEMLTQVEFILAWNAPSSLWPKCPNLKVVHSFGAGVDGIPVNLLPEHVEVARIVDPCLADDMAQYVLGHILNHKLRVQQYRQQQSEQVWRPKRARPGHCVGIMGMGQLGQAVAAQLLSNKFTLKGWSRSEKSIAGVDHYHGRDALLAFLSDLDYLVCLLPLTADTRGMLNAEVFAALPEHSVIINVARGAHLDEAALLRALDQGCLGGAVLDVFAKEPLPEQSPLWRHPKVTITPHVAALTSLSTATEQIVINYERMKRQQALRHVIDKSAGY
ncbi:MULTISPECIES: 2-hydroxyacid dehydrogenase [unclassified Pseudoalteromonas]|uniref:2-hydroxyacid dehydrogenase n=1 Tax=unclassified Pseudoalteromonas TaxID=194690 RepID=UPI00301443F9